MLNSVSILMLRPFERVTAAQGNRARDRNQSKTTHTIRLDSVNGESSGVALDSRNDPHFAGSRSSWLDPVSALEDSR